MTEMKEKDCAFEVYGGQVNIAKDNATMYVKQSNGIAADKLSKIIQEITGNLSGLKKEDEEEIRDVLDMVKKEFEKPKPSTSRLRNCVTLIAPMITIANGIPNLANNLQRLVDYINTNMH